MARSPRRSVIPLYSPWLHICFGVSDDSCVFASMAEAKQAQVVAQATHALLYDVRAALRHAARGGMTPPRARGA